MRKKPESALSPSKPPESKTLVEKRMRSFGSLEGKGWIADDFNDPLPDELLALFEGRDEPDW